MDSHTAAFMRRYMVPPVPKAYWRGHYAGKNPLDLWMYQEIIVETRPAAIIECGTNQGGSALFFADVCELLGHGHVYSMDVSPPRLGLRHSRLTLLDGSSIDLSTVARVKRYLRGRQPVMVSLDSLHDKEHVAKELALWSPLVSVGSYLVVEDTCVDACPTHPELGPGPFAALREFVRGTQCFRTDLKREKFLYTQQPYGWLKRVK